MSKDKMYTQEKSDGTRTAVFIVEERNAVWELSRWLVYSQYQQRKAFLRGTFRWRWLARLKMKYVVAEYAWESVER